MITTKCELEEGQLWAVMEAKHVNMLRHDGVPLRGNTLIEGLESGVLSYSDDGKERTYTWRLTELEKPKKTLRERFKKQFRVRRLDTLGETWYEVQEWVWCRPFWDTWTICNPKSKETEPIRYQSLHMAREAISFYQRSEKPRSSIVAHL